MDTELKCNRLTCRKALTDKAVVTTCSHIFCVDCANELFNAARLCPACESSLTEPDDIVVCSLHPSNDYKTSVLSGLSPSIILEICSRAISFWQYQIHQENSFQQAVLRNLNDKISQLQKQLDNVVREANSEIALLSNKNAELERDLEVERRKVRDLQEATREREKEYQKLKAQHDKIKRKALLAPGTLSANELPGSQEAAMRPLDGNISSNVNIGAVVGGMEASGIQRTPIVNRTSFGGFPSQRMVPGTGNATGGGDGWVPVHGNVQQRATHRQPLPRANTERRPYRTNGNVSDRSDSSSNEVENLLLAGAFQNTRVPAATSGWSTAPSVPNVNMNNPGFQRPRPTAQKVFAPTSSVKRGSGTFRPSIR